jgi:PEP-CTERM motif
MKKITKWILFMAMTAAAGNLMADTTVLSQNFDSGLSGSEALSGYHGGDITASIYGIVAGDGVGGTSALVMTNTTVGNAGNGYGYGAVQLQETGLSGNTSMNLSDYTLSFDAESTAGGSLNLQLQSFSGPGISGTVNTLNTAPANPGYGNDLTLNPTYTHYSLNLGDTSIFQGNDGFVPTSANWQIAFQLNGGGNGNPSSLTFDVDNVMLTMVPEPSSLALFAMGAMGGLLALRLRKA